MLALAGVSCGEIERDRIGQHLFAGRAPGAAGFMEYGEAEALCQAWQSGGHARLERAWELATHIDDSARRAA